MNFKLICKDNMFYADSRQVAELVDKRHDHLVRDIERYISAISTNPNLGALDFFVESGYMDRKGETRKCYLLTKKGCDMVANKMTGEKGVLFTATYIDKFYEMEHRLKSGTAKPLDESKTKRLAIMERNAKVREAKRYKQRNLALFFYLFVIFCIYVTKKKHLLLLYLHSIMCLQPTKGR